MRVWLKIRILTAYKRQRNFAKSIGMSDVRLSRIVNGKAEPNEKEKALIASELRVDDVDSLFVKQRCD